MTTTTTTTTTATRGYVFLDVDGILNPILRDGLHGDWRMLHIDGYDVWQSDHVSAWLNGLLEAGFQIVWATTWVKSPDMLDTLAEEWGLPADLPRISGLSWPTRFERRNDCGKRPAVELWLAENNVDPNVTPVAWVDDMLGPTDHAWADSTGVNCIDVNGYGGLSMRCYIDQIEQVLGIEP